MWYAGGGEPVIFGQLVLSSIPTRDDVPSPSRNLVRSLWIESSIDASEIGDEDVMLMINGLVEVSSALDKMAST
jgi:hypothetical protein